MTRPQDATTDDDATLEDVDATPDTDLHPDDEDTVILPRRDPSEDREPARDADPDPFIDDEDDDESDPADADMTDPDVTDLAAAEAAPTQPAVASAIPVAPSEASLSRYAPTGAIPIVGEANPVTGSMPVIGPIYPPKPRRPWIIATCVLAAGLIGASYLGWRMWTINEEWQAYAADVENANYDLGDQIAAVQQDLGEKQQEVDLLSQQLSTSNDRLTDVSAEKAAALDSQELASQVITTLEETLSLGQAATATLNSCIDGLEQLTDYLEAPEDEYEPEQIAEYASGVADLCTNADEATSRFQGALTE